METSERPSFNMECPDTTKTETNIQLGLFDWLPSDTFDFPPKKHAAIAMETNPQSKTHEINFSIFASRVFQNKEGLKQSMPKPILNTAYLQ